MHTFFLGSQPFLFFLFRFGVFICRAYISCISCTLKHVSAIHCSSVYYEVSNSVAIAIARLTLSRNSTGSRGRTPCRCCCARGCVRSPSCGRARARSPSARNSSGAPRRRHTRCTPPRYSVRNTWRARERAFNVSLVFFIQSADQHIHGGETDRATGIYECVRSCQR